MHLNIAKSLILQNQEMPFHAVNSGSNPLGDAKEIKGLEQNLSPFFVVGQICPTPCPTLLIKLLKSEGKLWTVDEKNMKRIFVNLFCVAFFSFVLFGCFFVPENFEMTARFNKNKTYIIKYDGMLAFTPYLSEKIKRQNDPKFTEQIKISDEKNIKYGKEVMDKNKSIKKMDYKGNGRYDTLIILECNIDENTDFFTGRKQVSLFDIPIFTQLDN